MEELILITGAARSGVSLIASVIEACGAWGGRTVRSTRADRHGSMENVEIRDSVVKPFLRGINCDPNGQCPLPELKASRQLAAKVGPWWRARVERIFTEQGYQQGPCFFASPQSCLIWPVWATAFPRARWVIIRRSDKDVIRSCMKTGFMSGYNNAAGWQRWLDVHKWRFAEMINGKLDVCQIWPQRVITGKFGEIQQMIRSLKLTWNEQAVQDLMTPILWKSGVFELTE